MSNATEKKGWALKLFWARKDGFYGHGQKLTILFAIEPGDSTLPAKFYGSVEHPRQWIRYLGNICTSNNMFRDFCENVCSDIQVNGIAITDDNRVFIWDNLATHHCAYVHMTVTARAGPCRFYIVSRPPYHPKFGPKLVTYSYNKGVSPGSDPTLCKPRHY